MELFRVICSDNRVSIKVLVRVQRFLFCRRHKEAIGHVYKITGGSFFGEWVDQVLTVLFECDQTRGLSVWMSFSRVQSFFSILFPCQEKSVGRLSLTTFRRAAVGFSIVVLFDSPHDFFRLPFFGGRLLFFDSVTAVLDGKLLQANEIPVLPVQ